MRTSRTYELAAAIAAVAITSLGIAPQSASTAATSAALVGTAPVQATSSTSMPSAAPGRPSVDTARYAYGWPVRPFQAQHPVRGFFGDPRIGNHGRSRQFHFGVDVSAPDGTPVYATLTGTATVHPLHPDAVLVTAPGGIEFSYWHVVPSIRSGQRVIAYKTVLGHIVEGQTHVHFSERLDGRYLNPLRPGAMGPFVDRTKPRALKITTEIQGASVSPVAHRPFDIVAQVGDETPMAVPPPWHDLPVMPALVRWRLLSASGRVRAGWQTVTDFRTTIPSASEFDSTWAPGATQNHVRTPAKYRLFLDRFVRDLRPGSYTIEVDTRDTRGNRSVTRGTFVVAAR